jgi:choline dehydrogenase
VDRGPVSCAGDTFEISADPTCPDVEALRVVMGPFDGRTRSVAEEGMHDIVIVGGGSAGCVLAARLSEDGHRSVLLIEAGADHVDFEQAPDAVRLAVGGQAQAESLAALDWGFTAVGSHRGGRIPLPRGKVLGGSGAINGCIWLRGLPEDFARWAEMVDPSWAWEHVLPAYRAIESDPVGNEAVHGRTGPFPIHRFSEESWLPTQAAFHAACVELGYGTTADENAPDSVGVGQLPLNQDDGYRWGPARALFDEAVRARPNLTIMPRTRALSIDVVDGAARGVHVVGPGGAARIDGAEIIVSAGAVGSPQLLLLSGIGPRGPLHELGVEIAANVPGVGVGLRDHPKTWIEWRVRDDIAGTEADPLLQLSARYTASGSDLRGDMMLYPNSIVPGPEPGSRHFRIEAVNNLQLSWGSLRLRSADPDVQPHIDLSLLSVERDLTRLVDAVERSIAIGETAVMREVVGDLVLPEPGDLEGRAGLAAYVERTIMTGQHISSSCKMGPADDDLAVVGPDCRVRGLRGLRVIDGSIMPDSVRANTHATVLAMAELMAGRIIAGD